MTDVCLCRLHQALSYYSMLVIMRLLCRLFLSSSAVANLALLLIAYLFFRGFFHHCRDSDRTSIRTTDVLRNVAELELIQAPNLSFIPPKSYSNLPQLKGI